MVIHRPNHQFIIMLHMIVLEIHLLPPCVKLLHMNMVAAIWLRVKACNLLTLQTLYISHLLKLCQNYDLCPKTQRGTEPLLILMLYWSHCCEGGIHHLGFEDDFV